MSENQQAQKPNSLILDLARHGKAAYGDDYPSLSGFEIGANSKDLTPQGEQQAIALAERIVSGLDPEKDVVILWGSATTRAVDTENFIIKALKEKEIPIIKVFKGNSGSETGLKLRERQLRFRSGQVRSWDVYNPKAVWDKLMQTGKTPREVYSKELNSPEFDDWLEIQDKVRVRAERFIDWMTQICKKINTSEKYKEQLLGKQLHIISVSHSEIISTLIQDIYGLDSKPIDQGKEFRLVFNYDAEEERISITAIKEGETKENIRWNDKLKKFILP